MPLGPVCQRDLVAWALGSCTLVTGTCFGSGGGVYAEAEGGVGVTPGMTTHALNAGGSVRAEGGGGALSRADFAALFEEHSRLFWCIAAAILGDRSRASDVVQEAAVVGLARLQQFESGTSFQAWMGQIVRFVALNDARKMKPVAVSDETMSTVPSPRAGSDGAGGLMSVNRFNGQLVAGQEAFHDDVARALRSLDETARACLLMKTVLDLPYARIGEVLGIPEGTAMSHVHRSRAVMRVALTGDGQARRVVP